MMSIGRVPVQISRSKCFDKTPVILDYTIESGFTGFA